jgi:hypothetical protein
VYRPSEALPLVPSSPPRRRGTLLGQSRRGTRCCRPGRRRRRRRPRGWSRTRTRSRRGGRRCPGRSSEAADAAFPKFDASLDSETPDAWLSASASDDARVVRRTTGDRLTRRRSSRGRATARGATHAAIAAAVLSTACVRTRVCQLPTTTFHNENILSENVWCDDVTDQNSRRVRLDRAR